MFFVRRLSPFLSLHFAEFALSLQPPPLRFVGTCLPELREFCPSERNPISESDSEMSTGLHRSKADHVVILARFLLDVGGGQIEANGP